MKPPKKKFNRQNGKRVKVVTLTFRLEIKNYLPGTVRI